MGCGGGGGGGLQNDGDEKKEKGREKEEKNGWIQISRGLTKGVTSKHKAKPRREEEINMFVEETLPFSEALTCCKTE